MKLDCNVLNLAIFFKRLLKSTRFASVQIDFAPRSSKNSLFLILEALSRSAITRVDVGTVN